MRLVDQLTKLEEEMSGSYEVLSAQLTEIKMDHKGGQKKSDKLSKLLGNWFGWQDGWSLLSFLLAFNIANIALFICFASVSFISNRNHGKSLSAQHLLIDKSLPMDLANNTDDDASDWLQELIAYNREAMYGNHIHLILNTCLYSTLYKKKHCSMGRLPHLAK